MTGDRNRGGVGTRSTAPFVRLESHLLRRLAHLSPRLSARAQKVLRERRFKRAATRLRDLHEAIEADVLGEGGYTSSHAVVVVSDVDERGQAALHHFWIEGRITMGDLVELGERAITRQRRTDTLRAILADIADGSVGHPTYRAAKRAGGGA